MFRSHCNNKIELNFRLTWNVGQNWAKNYTKTTNYVLIACTCHVNLILKCRFSESQTKQSTKSRCLPSRFKNSNNKIITELCVLFMLNMITDHFLFSRFYLFYELGWRTSRHHIRDKDFLFSDGIYLVNNPWSRGVVWLNPQTIINNDFITKPRNSDVSQLQKILVLFLWFR